MTAVSAYNYRITIPGKNNKDAFDRLENSGRIKGVFNAPKDKPHYSKVDSYGINHFEVTSDASSIVALCAALSYITQSTVEAISIEDNESFTRLNSGDYQNPETVEKADRLRIKLTIPVAF